MEAVPSAHVRVATSGEYWINAQMRNHSRHLKAAPCKNCAKTNKPCMIYLALNPGCVACMISLGKRSCSFVPAMKTGHVHLPYSNIIGGYFHMMLISHFMQGLPLLLWPQNFGNVNFYPGIEHGTTDDFLIQKDRVSKIKKSALENYHLLANGN